VVHSGRLTMTADWLRQGHKQVSEGVVH